MHRVFTSFKNESFSKSGKLQINQLHLILLDVITFKHRARVLLHQNCHVIQLHLKLREPNTLLYNLIISL